MNTTKAENRQNLVEFTQERYDSLKEAYKDALDAGVETFEWDGIELCTRFAQYVLEYLGTIFD